MYIMDNRLAGLKSWRRGMQSYTLMLYEFVLEMKPKNVLEIGVQYGQSTKAMLLAMGENRMGQLVSIDHKSRHNILDGEFEDVKPYWKFIKSSSHLPGAVQLATDLLPPGELYDLLFVDGDHTYEGVKADFNDYQHLVKPGGVITFHDTSNYRAGVSQLWEEITWEKFNLNWGHAAKAVIPGFGICRKPLQ